MPNTAPVDCSVCIVTYNHGPFIEEAIQSVVQQKTHFTFEICIGEDDSNDDTRAICERLATAHPDQIKLFKRDRKDVIYKDGSPTGIFNFIETLKACKGDLIFILEGDDVWTSPEKLQQQVQFMHDHPDVAACFHPASMIDDQGNIVKDVIEHFDRGQALELSEVLRMGSFAPSASLCVRRSVFDPLPEWYASNPSDWKIEVMALLQGKLVCCTDEPLSAYRLHQGGLWTGMAAQKQLRFKESMMKDLRAVPELKDHLEPLEMHWLRMADKVVRNTNLPNSIRLSYLRRRFVRSPLPLVNRIYHFLRYGFFILAKR